MCIADAVQYGLSKIGLGSPIADPSAVKGKFGVAGSLVDAAKGLPPLEQPPVPPDLSDELVRRAAALQRMRQAMGQGIGSTFLTGPLGLTTPAPTAMPQLGGA